MEKFERTFITLILGFGVIGLAFFMFAVLMVMITEPIIAPIIVGILLASYGIGRFIMKKGWY